MTSTTLDTEPFDLLIPLDRLNRDIKEAVLSLGRREIRFLADTYYTFQQERIRSANRLRALSESAEPNRTVEFIFSQMRRLERQIQGVLDVHTQYSPMGRWARSIHGIGPVIAAGLDAYIDITRCPTVSGLWRFAGLDPTIKWIGNDGAREIVKTIRSIAEDDAEYRMNEFEAKRYAMVPREKMEDCEVPLSQIVAASRMSGRALDALINLAYRDGNITYTSLERAMAMRPWNENLHTLCFKIGDSFVKHQNNEKDIYGKIYAARKAEEHERNDRGEYAEQAAQVLKQKRIGKTTDAYAAYSQGKLPKAHIHARAMRYTVKLFLSHWHYVAYMLHYKQEPPQPYAIEHAGHAHFIPPPNLDLVHAMMD